MKLVPKTPLYLHIGLPRTGTTTIQHFLRINASILARHGIIYPDAGRSYEAHHELAASLEGVSRDWVRSIDADAVLGALRSEVMSSKPNKVVLSSEIFAFIRNAKILRDAFQKEYDVVVLLFLRRQDEWIESCYRQDVTVGEFRGTIDEYLNVRQHHLDFNRLVEFWEALIGVDNVKVHVAKPSSASTNIQRAFLEMCGISWQPDFVVNEDANLSLSNDCIEFLKCSPDSRRISMRYQRLIALLADYSKEYPDAPSNKHILTPLQRQSILTFCAEGNRSISERYFSGGPKYLFNDSEAVDFGDWNPYPGLSPQAAARIGHFLFERLID
jgi:hypothetical protein